MKNELETEEPVTEVTIIKDAPFDYRNLIRLVNEKSITTKERTKQFGEVYTPVALIEKMCDALPPDIWTNPAKTVADLCCGRGNMPAVMVTRLMEGLKDIMPDERKRYKHIMENMIYMAELQHELAMDIEAIFNPDGELKLNLYVGDALKMPDDYFDLSYEERRKKYPLNKVRYRKISHTIKPYPKPKEYNDWMLAENLTKVN